MPSYTQFNPMRLRSYIFRLPLCTRLLLLAIVGLWAATIPFTGLRDWASLEPDKMNLGTSRCSFVYFWVLFWLEGKESGELELKNWAAVTLQMRPELTEVRIQHYELQEVKKSFRWGSSMFSQISYCPGTSANHTSLRSVPPEHIPPDASQLPPHDIQRLRSDATSRALRG